MTVYKLYGAGTGGTENSVASLDVQFNGVINAIAGSMSGDLDADADSCQWEVSFLSTNTLASNDSRGSLFALFMQLAVGAAGSPIASANNSVSGLNVIVNQGERIHLHAVCSASLATSSMFFIYVTDGASPNLTRRR